jgi:hypothetical protein
MFRYFQFFIGCAIVLGACVYWPLAELQQNYEEETATGQLSKQVLQREAELVAYFCLSDIPPVGGKATIPRAWEKALDSSVELRESTGEVSGSHDAFTSRVDELTNLQSGESIYGRTESEHILAYRPHESPNWYIVITKPLAALKFTNVESETGHPLRTAVALGLIGSLILTVMARFVIGSGAAEKKA